MRKLTLLALLFVLFACKAGDPVRATIDEIAEAAEDRDVFARAVRGPRQLPMLFGKA